jgi:putative flippase GtrA
VHDDGFALPMAHQVRRYLVVQAAQFGITAASAALLPHRVGLSPEVVYLLTVGILTIANFLLFRSVVFHRDEPSRPAAESSPAAGPRSYMLD